MTYSGCVVVGSDDVPEDRTVHRSWAVSSDRDVPSAFPEVSTVCARLRRGDTEIEALWRQLDLDGLFFVRPDYYGLPLHLGTDDSVAALGFTDLELLAQTSGTCPWVCLSGAQIVELPFRPRWLVIDPGSDHELMVRLPAAAPRRLNDAAVPYVVDIHRAVDTTVRARTWLTGPDEAMVKLP